MLNYKELTFKISPFHPWNEILTFELSEIGFESFSDDGNDLKAYIPANSYDAKALIELVHEVKLKFDGSLVYEVIEIQGQNWNSTWEENFDPVFVDEDLSIVAPFHGKEHRRNCVIEIEPKMSFGTGHHQTTFMMCRAMKELKWVGQKVLDMGTGTGVLAIYAEKLGSDYICAVDIESWAVDNTLENIARNRCSKIIAKLGDIEDVTELDYQVILANINRNVLKMHIPKYAQMIQKNGHLLLSGFFVSDQLDLIEFTEDFGFKLIKKYEKEQWACLAFERY